MLNVKSGNGLRDDAAFVFFVILGVVLVMILVNLPNHRDNVELFKRSASLAAGVKELENQNGRLEKEIAALKTDRYYIEAVARKKFLLLKPGETIILKQRAQ